MACAVIRLHTGVHGAGIGAMLSLAFAVTIVIGLVNLRPLPHSIWRIGLLLLPALSLWNRPLFETLSSLLHSFTGATLSLPWIALAVIAVATAPPLRIGMAALRTGGGIDVTLASLAGLCASLSDCSPSLMSAIAATGLLLSDTVATPERGWSRPGHGRQFEALVMTGLGAMWMATGWAHLRTVFDPTPLGVIALVFGAVLARGLFPGNVRPPFIGLSMAGIGIWWFLGELSWLAPQVAALGFNGSLGLPDPSLWLSVPFIILGAITGPFIRCDPKKSLAWFVLGAGLWVGPSILTGSTMIWWSIGLAGLAAVTARRSRSLVFSVAVIGLGAGIEGWSTGSSTAPIHFGVWASADTSRSLGRWSEPPTGLTGGLKALSTAGTIATWSDGKKNPTLASTLDGLTRSTTGNLAESEEMLGHLVALLSPNQDSVLLLGDELGNTARGLAAHPDRITQIAAPFPRSIRFLADADPVRRQIWMTPSHPLFPEHPSVLLHRNPPVSAIVEVSHTPWADGAGSRWDEPHVQDIKGRLAPDGMYALCVHLRYWPDGTAAAIGQTLGQHFEYIQIWNPPEGADSLLFLASDSSLSFSTLSERFSAGRTGLESLGFTSPETLAGNALLGTDGVLAWGTPASKLPPAGRMNSTIFDKPVLHVGALPSLMNTHPNPWSETVPEGIAEVRQARKLMIELFKDATQGQLESAFATARNLAKNYGTIGASAIGDLIAPHIADARTAIRAARREGPNSKRWDDAQRFATTARMLAPRHAGPLTLLGELALARGHAPKALEHFTKALDISPGHIPALDGLAQCARLDDDQTKAEQALRDSTRHAPRDWRAWHNLAVFYLETDRLEQAKVTIDTSVGLAPADEIGPLIVLTEVYLRQGEAGAALLRSEQCTQISPKSGLAWYLRGRAHYALNRYQEAESDFRKAVITDSDLIEARAGIGMVRAILGDHIAATNAFKDVLSRDPNNGAARENLRRLQLVAPQRPTP
jgi:tetratricopeptide (TPR) repeat protein